MSAPETCIACVANVFTRQMHFKKAGDVELGQEKRMRQRIAPMPHRCRHRSQATILGIATSEVWAIPLGRAMAWATVDGLVSRGGRIKAPQRRTPRNWPRSRATVPRGVQDQQSWTTA